MTEMSPKHVYLTVYLQFIDESEIIVVFLIYGTQIFFIFAISNSRIVFLTIFFFFRILESTCTFEIKRI